MGEWAFWPNDTGSGGKKTAYLTTELPVTLALEIELFSMSIEP
jgi:hypothetical protein